MTQWWLLTLSGLMASSHCVGMCGGFAALIGLNTGTWWRNLRAQLVFSSGRLMTYCTMGAAAGYIGQSTIRVSPSLVHMPALLCLVSGLILLREGLISLGIWPRFAQGTTTSGCLFRSLFSAFYRRPGLHNSFIAGLLTGMLPCGLVYAFVSLAASSGDLLTGVQTMAAFGLGTVPLLVLAGTGMSLLSWAARQRLLKFSAVAVVATALLTLGRGAAFLNTSSPEKAKCPFCADKATAARVQGELR